MPKNKITDPFEIRVENILKKNGIKYIHESERNGIDQRLDFYIPEFDVYIECKQMHSERSISQLGSAENVILIQGDKSILFLEQIISKK